MVDETDPMLAAYRGIFPSLFTPMADMPATLREHLRYPEDLFRVQSDMFQQYHVTDPRVFFNNTLVWQVARDPSTTPRSRCVWPTAPRTGRWCRTTC